MVQASRGLVRAFEGLRLFEGLRVLEEGLGFTGASWGFGGGGVTTICLRTPKKQRIFLLVRQI